jgi:hypothetical protein
MTWRAISARPEPQGSPAVNDDDNAAAAVAAAAAAAASEEHIGGVTSAAAEAAGGWGDSFWARPNSAAEMHHRNRTLKQELNASAQPQQRRRAPGAIKARGSMPGDAADRPPSRPELGEVGSPSNLTCTWLVNAIPAEETNFAGLPHTVCDTGTHIPPSFPFTSFFS